MTLRALLARGLERGVAPDAVAGAWERVAGATLARGLVRPLHVPAGVVVVSVGGATLGGSGKTPVALALAAALASRGEHVAFVGHAHGASPGAARIVAADDLVSFVGDEALVAARALAPSGVRVIVAESRQRAVDLAAARARVLVVDGPLQVGPAGACAPILSLDAESPWGSGVLVPLGDLRASPDDLLAATALVIAIGDRPPRDPRLARAHLASPSIALPELPRGRLGLIAGIARPERVRRALAALGVEVTAEVELGDHEPLSVRTRARVEEVGRARGLRAWLATEKAATRLPAAFGSRPVLAVGHAVTLPDAAIDAVIARLREASRSGAP